MYLKPIQDAYLNLKSKQYKHDYVNLAHIEEGMIHFPNRTTFLSNLEKETLKNDPLLNIKNAVFITFISGVYSLVCHIDLNANIKTHEMVIPDTVQGITHNYQYYNAEAAPILLLTKETIDFRKIISDNKYTIKHDLNEEDYVYVYKEDKANTLLESFSTIKDFYIADGHHRYTASKLSSKKTDILTTLSSMQDIHLEAITRVMIPKQDFCISMDYCKENFEFTQGPLKSGYVEINYKKNRYFIKLIELNDDLFSNHDVYRLTTQVISQAFNEYDSTQLSYKEQDYLVTEDEISFKVAPMKKETFIEMSDQSLILPPKSSNFNPKFPSLLIMSRREI